MAHSKEKKLELVEDTVKYYSEDTQRRCLGNGQCYYSPVTADNPLSSGCAVGRLVSPELQLILDKHFACGLVDIFHLLPEDIQEYGQDLLEELQRFHDGANNWDDDGLTLYGQTNLEKIYEKINLNII